MQTPLPRQMRARKMIQISLLLRDLLCSLEGQSQAPPLQLAPLALPLHLIQLGNRKAELLAFPLANHSSHNKHLAGVLQEQPLLLPLLPHLLLLLLPQPLVREQLVQQHLSPRQLPLLVLQAPQGPLRQALQPLRQALQLLQQARLPLLQLLPPLLHQQWAPPQQPLPLQPLVQQQLAPHQQFPLQQLLQLPLPLQPLQQQVPPQLAPQQAPQQLAPQQLAPRQLAPQQLAPQLQALLQLVPQQQAQLQPLQERVCQLLPQIRQIRHPPLHHLPPRPHLHLHPHQQILLPQLLRRAPQPLPLPLLILLPPPLPLLLLLPPPQLDV